MPNYFNMLRVLPLLSYFAATMFSTRSTSAFLLSTNHRPLRSTSSAIFAKKSVITETTTDGEIVWKSRTKCWRPTVQDVENISWGKPAKKKGTGSRGVPHRLNHDEERKLFDQARKKGFLEVTGSGWRSQRRDAPLLNSYRSLCDARYDDIII